MKDCIEGLDARLGEKGGALLAPLPLLTDAKSGGVVESCTGSSLGREAPSAVSRRISH